MKRERKKRFGRRGGFSVVELSIVVMIVAFLSVTVIMTMNQDERTRQWDILEKRFAMIGDALYNFRLVNFRLPCPSDSSLALTDANYGWEAAGDDCTGVGITSNLDNDSGSVHGGGVPTETLNLPKEAGLGPDNMTKLTYYVAKEANMVCQWVTSRGTYGVPYNGELQVEDESGTVLKKGDSSDPEEVFAVVFWSGKNRHGAYDVGTNRINAGVTNSAELENCKCDSSANSQGDVVRTVRIQRTMPTNVTNKATVFDDIGRFYPRHFFYTYAEKNK